MSEYSAGPSMHRVRIPPRRDSTSQNKTGLLQHWKLAWETQGTQFFQTPQRLNTKHLSKYDRAVVACHY